MAGYRRQIRQGLKETVKSGPFVIE